MCYRSGPQAPEFPHSLVCIEGVVWPTHSEYSRPALATTCQGKRDRVSMLGSTARWLWAQLAVSFPRPPGALARCVLFAIFANQCER